MRILIASSIWPDCIDRLRAQHDVVCAFNTKDDALRQLITDREALIFRSGVQVGADLMARAPDLKLILRAGAGLDNIDLDFAKQRGIQVTSLPVPGSRAVAELAFALMLGLARNVLRADRQWRQGHWVKREMTGYQLAGKVLGVIGLGRIGTQVAQLGLAWGMDAVGCVEHPSPARAGLFMRMGIRLVDLDELLYVSDFVSLHVPRTELTTQMIGAEALARMKPGAFLVNLSRGGVVNELALLRALKEGRLAGAGLDVHEKEGDGEISPLAGLDNVILTPHIGAGTFESQREIGETILQVIESFGVHPGQQAKSDTALAA